MNYISSFAEGGPDFRWTARNSSQSLLLPLSLLPVERADAATERVGLASPLTGLRLMNGDLDLVGLESRVAAGEPETLIGLRSNATRVLGRPAPPVSLSASLVSSSSTRLGNAGHNGRVAGDDPVSAGRA